MSDKVSAQHLARRAILYVRQSTAQQLARNVAEHGGTLVASFPVAVITSRLRSDGLTFDRQHVTMTGSGTLLIESAYDASSSNGLHRKVYWNALVSTASAVHLETLDRRRPGHYVWTWDVCSYVWLTTSSLVTP